MKPKQHAWVPTEQSSGPHGMLSAPCTGSHAPPDVPEPAEVDGPMVLEVDEPMEPEVDEAPLLVEGSSGTVS